MNVTRRFFLKSTAALAATYCGVNPGRLLAEAGLDPNNLLTVRRSKTLVVIFLRGGMDGLNMVVPYKDPGYYKLRKNIALAEPVSPAASWTSTVSSGCTRARRRWLPCSAKGRPSRCTQSATI